MHHILDVLARLVVNNVDLAFAAVNRVLLVRLQQAMSWREVTNNITDLPVVVNALKRGES